MKYLSLLIIPLFFIACGDNSDFGFINTNSSQAPKVTSKASAIAQPLLVVRVEYDNQLFVHDADTWAAKIFGFEKHQLNNYFKEVSQNLITFTPVKESDTNYGSRQNDGVVTAHLYINHPNSGSSSTIHNDLKLALEQANSYVDFQNYDIDKSGSLSVSELNIIFIIAGAEDAYYPAETINSVWAHQSCINNVTITLDNVKVANCQDEGSYALFGERHVEDVIPAHDATIGIIAHELGHELYSLPDLYPTASISSSGIGYFGLMGGGLWGYDSYAEGKTLPGNTPSHFCAWSKIHNAWVQPLVTTQSGFIKLPSTSQSNYGVVKIELNSDEYLLMENRAIDGYDAGLYAVDGNYVGGLALWHINESVIQNNLQSNSVQNSEKNKGVDLIEARFTNIDTSQTARGNAKNLFYAPNVESAQITSNIRLEDISSPSNFMTLKVVQ